MSFNISKPLSDVLLRQGSDEQLIGKRFVTNAQTRTVYNSRFTRLRSAGGSAFPSCVFRYSNQQYPVVANTPRTYPVILHCVATQSDIKNQSRFALVVMFAAKSGEKRDAAPHPRLDRITSRALGDKIMAWGNRGMLRGSREGGCYQQQASLPTPPQHHPFLLPTTYVITSVLGRVESSTEN
ncbi:hypothetical protein J6590_075811 [Homalodisca vitripennis]|nr:hypothetical protein J6590_075811 [Homalodisca vitripennis]